VRHATPDDLDRLDGLLGELRGIERLKERAPGTFYVRSVAFLHFHADGDEFYADVKLDGSEFERRRTTTGAEQQELVSAVRAHLAARPAGDGA
jgi:hypothetical protein